MYRVVVPTSFESNLRPEHQNKIFFVWGVFDTEEEAQLYATWKNGWVEKVR